MIECADCRYFKSYALHRDIGRCMRLAPGRTLSGTFPEVSWGDACGEGESKNKPQPTVVPRPSTREG